MGGPAEQGKSILDAASVTTARIGQYQASWPPPQQPQAKLVLETANSVAHRTWRDAKVFGRGVEIAGLRHRLEGLQAAQGGEPPHGVFLLEIISIHSGDLRVCD